MLTAGACARNRQPIAGRFRDRLGALLGRPWTLLEVGSGTGEHAAYLSQALDNVTWHPTEADVDGPLMQSIALRNAGRANVAPVRALDATRHPWPVPADAFDVVFACNVIHIAPVEVLEGIVAGAYRACRPGGYLVTYGPYKFGGACSPQSSVDFDAWLRTRDARFGIRDFEHVDRCARDAGFALHACDPMPASNHMCFWVKAPPPSG